MHLIQTGRQSVELRIHEGLVGIAGERLLRKWDRMEAECALGLEGGQLALALDVAEVGGREEIEGTHGTCAKGHLVSGQSEHFV